MLCSRTIPIWLRFKLQNFTLPQDARLFLFKEPVPHDSKDASTRLVFRELNQCSSTIATIENKNSYSDRHSL